MSWVVRRRPVAGALLALLLGACQAAPVVSPSPSATIDPTLPSSPSPSASPERSLPPQPFVPPAPDWRQGTYDFGAGGRLAVVTHPGRPDGLAAFGLDDGAYRLLTPAGGDSLAIGPAFLESDPATGRLAFERAPDGSVAAATLTTDSATYEAGPPEARERIPIAAESEGVRLAGTLVLPADRSGPIPAVVTLHGSDRSAQAPFGNWAEFFTSQGIGFLAMDKRGVGQSGGICPCDRAGEGDLRLLAADAIGALEALRARPEIDPSRVGLFGGSQAGWVGTIAATQPGRPDFEVLLVGPTVSVGEEGTYSRLTDNGSRPAQQTDAEIRALMAGLSPSGFNPRPLLPQIDIPILWIYGEKDGSVPTPESVAILQAIDPDAERFTIVVAAGAGHSLLAGTQGLNSELPSSPGYATEVVPAMADWLASRTN